MKQVGQHPESLWARLQWRRGQWWWEEVTTEQMIRDEPRLTWGVFTSTDSTDWVCRTYKAANWGKVPKGGREWERSSRREVWGRPNRRDISVKTVKLISAMPVSLQCAVPTMFSSSVLHTFIASHHFIKFSTSADQTIQHKRNSFHAFYSY